MSDTKHTPGPWAVSTVPTSIGHTHKIEPIGARLFVDHRDKAEKDAKTLTALANAHLIAASPDMYAALQPVLTEAKQRADYMHDTWNPDAHVELTLTIAELRAIHAAIAAAEGRTP